MFRSAVCAWRDPQAKALWGGAVLPPGDSWQRLEALVTPGEGGGSCIHWGRPRVLANFPRSTGTHAAGPRGGSHVQTGRAEVGAREETAQGRSGCFLVALGRAAPSSTPPLFQPPTEHRAQSLMRNPQQRCCSVANVATESRESHCPPKNHTHVSEVFTVLFVRIFSEFQWSPV